MLVSVIIPTLNPNSEEILNIFNKLKSQTIQNEIIIIDSGSSRNVVDLLKKNSDVFLQISKKEFNHALTRNKASEYSKGDFLLFMTQDATPYNEFLIENLLHPFYEIPDLAISYARHIPKHNVSLEEKFSRNFNYPKRSLLKSKEDLGVLGIKTFFTSNSCAMYKKDIFVSLGKFDKVNVSEDMMFSYKSIMAGYKVYYNSKALIIHSHDYTFVSLFKRYKEIGKFFKLNDDKFDNIKIQNEGLKFFFYSKKYFFIKSKKIFFKSFVIDVVKYTAYYYGKFF